MSNYKFYVGGPGWHSAGEGVPPVGAVTFYTGNRLKRLTSAMKQSASEAARSRRRQGLTGRANRTSSVHTTVSAEVPISLLHAVTDCDHT